ncbi:uncharacterized protein LOC128168611 [Crassostrea angulata]|uniref:uncharacterized protein LOC128168611 n=1 Tax=Magallana angulata TaxID=2784310 RepID=UPI0022B185C5|nr:uncharacterized protein LOC128168611 [Crassostrea angulata]
MPGLSFPPHAGSSPVNCQSPGISSATGEGMKLAGLSALSLVAADDGTDSSLYGPFHQRCTGSSSTISITGEMGNDEWTVITLQLTDSFRSPSLFVFNGGLWRNGCSAAFMSGAGKFLSLGSKMGAFLAQFIATKHCHNIVLLGNIFT